MPQQVQMFKYASAGAPHLALLLGHAMLIVEEELEGFFVDSEDDEPNSRRLSLAGSRTDLWDDEDDGLSQCPTSEVLLGVRGWG